MCQKCLDLVHEIVPQVPDDRICEFLMSATCYPFGDPEEHLRPQLVEIASLFANGELGDDIIEGAKAWADAEMSAAHEVMMLQERDWS